MKTQDEIVERVKSKQKFDIFGTIADLICYLDFEHAKQFLKPEAKADEWEQIPLTREGVLKEMLDYMPFAWEKANDCRGLSAARSMCHYAHWVWLLGDNLGELENYSYYGKDNLIRICNHYGWDHDKWDDHIRVNSESEL